MILPQPFLDDTHAWVSSGTENCPVEGDSNDEGTDPEVGSNARRHVLTGVTAVILSAGPVPNEIATLFRCPSIALVPINGRPLITLQFEMLRRMGVKRFKVALRPRDARARDYIEQYSRVSSVCVEIVEIHSDRGPGGTLLEAVTPEEAAQGLIVLLGDTLIEGGPALQAKKNQVFTAAVQDPERWCMVFVDEAGAVTSLENKPLGACAGAEAAVGFYWFGNVSAPSWTRLKAAKGTRVELATILDGIKRGHGLQSTSIAGWLDCGNVDLLLATRRRMIAARSFNTLQIDELRSTVCKRSRNGAKFRHEINYYRLLPPDLAVFFPRLLGYETSQPDAYVEMEYYSYPTLNEVYIYEDHNTAFWTAVIEKIGAILCRFSDRSVAIDPEACSRFYREKLRDRLDAAAAQTAALRRLLAAHEIELNGRRVRGVPRLLADLETEMRRVAVSVQGAVMHGDLCFANILLEPLNRTMRFIDPRGSFHEVGIFGDSRYDHAKLWHSVDGNYDVIISDMFNVRSNGTSLDYGSYAPGSREHVLKCLSEIVPPTTNRRDIRLIEGSLFLSMLPLHSDHPRRQLAMLATGLRILNEEL